MPVDGLFSIDLSRDAIDAGSAPHPPAFIIEELTGTRRKIVLTGRSLPYRGVGFGQRVRTKVTRYPGNPVATQQILGPEDKDTSIHGMWKDRYIQGTVLVDGDPNQVTTAQEMVDLINDVQRASNLLRVQWYSTVRSGIITDFEPSYDRTQDVHWSITFEWRSRNDEIAPRAAAEPDPNGVLKASNGIDDMLTFEPFPGSLPELAAQIIAAIDSIRGLTGSLFDQIRTINDLLSLPANILGAIAALVDSIVAELQEELSRLLEHPTATQTAARTVTGALQFESWKRDQAASYVALRTEAISTDADAQTKFAPPPVRYVTVPADTTLYALSTTYYGTPDLAAYIARVNGAVFTSQTSTGVRITQPTGSIRAGTVIAIPPRPSSADAAGGCCGC